jgi:hypothetical protein
MLDANIAHAKNYNGTLEKSRDTKNIIYLRPPLKKYDGISIITDKYINSVKNIESKYKVAWIMEPRALDPIAYSMVEHYINDYDLVLTHDNFLLKNYPNKCEFLPADGLFVDTDSIFNDKIVKSKHVSHIYSGKKDLEGHKLRHKIAEKLGGFDCYGHGTINSLKYKSDALNDYMFSIIIENNKAINYFTEKILDCFACRTIPIYWGAPNIGDFFDMDSVIVFENIDELEYILNTIDSNTYKSMQSSLGKNYEKCLNYYDFDELIYQKLKKRFPDA